MDYNFSDWDSSHNSHQDLLQKSITDMQDLTYTVGQMLTQLQYLTGGLQTVRDKTISPGAQFLLMHFLGMLEIPIKNKTSDGKLLKLLLDNGNAEDFRKWLTDLENQIKSLNNAKALGHEIYHSKQPLTFKNISKVCEILESVGLENEINEPFILKDHLESYEK